MDGSGRQASSGTSSAPQDASAEAGTTWTVRMSNYRAREDGPLDVRVRIRFLWRSDAGTADQTLSARATPDAGVAGPPPG